MSIGLRRPHESLDFAEVARFVPPPPDYFEERFFEPREAIEARQLSRLKEKALMTWEIPFHRRRWQSAGVDPRAITRLEDLRSIPTYDVDDIRKSIEAHPPLGDYQAVRLEDARREPMRVYMSGGTTGQSRPTLYTRWDREAGAILTARALYMQGIRPGDVVLNAWSYGTHNGAWAMDEALDHWLNCVVLTTGTGTVTPSRKQVELAIEYGAKAILTTGDYLLRLAAIAREMGVDPEKDLKLCALPNIGDREALESTFGLPSYASYGFHEVQWVAVECPARQGLHVFEDAFIVEVVDPETGELLPDGKQGSLVVTELYKTGSPQFRYNIMDLSTRLPVEQCACGSWLRRIAPFAGRADNMVKLRGINVWPEALGEAVGEHGLTTADYFVRAIRSDDRDELVVSVVSEAPESAFESIELELEQTLRDRFGLKIAASVVPPGALDDWTEIRTSPKPKRFRDER